MSHRDLPRLAFQYLRGLQRAGISDLRADSSTPLASLIWESEAVPESDADAQLKASAVAESKPGLPDGEQAAGHSRPSASGANPLPTTALRAPDSGDSGSLSDYGPGLPLGDRIAGLKQLQQQVQQCQRCAQLTNCRTQTVFGIGNPQPRLAFFGEGPGADEDRLGEPFVGRAGQLLNKIIEACQMSRDDVYIFNTVKCRPPGNRNPLDQEISNCWEYAAQQLEILQPQYICCLGSVAARTLLNTKESVGRLRGRFHQYRSSRVIVTYHPAYLLRTPQAKAKTWEDMKMLLDEMGIQY